MSKISVVVPVYKVEKFLRQCLDSIINQTYRDLEIILVDDGSPDNCGSICDEYALMDNRIQVIHKQNGGLPAARNDGMKTATGKWIAFVDSDDWLGADYFEKMVEALDDRQPDVLLSGGFLNVGGVNNRKTVRTVLEPFIFDQADEIQTIARRILSRREPVEHIAPTKALTAPWDKMYNLAFLRDRGIQFHPDIRVADDIYFNWEVFSHACKVMGCTYIGYHYRIVQASIVHGYRPDEWEAVQTLLNRIYADYKSQKNIKKFPVEIVYAQVIHGVGASIRCSVLHPDNHSNRHEKKEEYQKMKSHPLVKESVKSRDNRYLLKHQLILKYLLRQPWFWPVELSWSAYMKLKNR